MPAYKYQTKEGKNLWYCSFHYADWMGQNKRKKKMGFATRREALDWERTFLDKECKNPDILFSSLVENYMKDCDTHMKPTTLENKQYIYDLKLIPYFGKMKVSDITPLRVRTWQNELINYKDENGEAYSPTYLKSIHAQLSAILNYAVKYYNLPGNPCKATGSMGKGKAAEMKIWTRDQFEQFLPFEKKQGYHCAFNILFYSGVRASELLALTPEDVPRDRNVLRINKNFAVVKGVAMFLTPKTERSIREVSIHKSLHDEILQYIDDLCLDPEERIFYFTKSGLLKEFHNISEKAGLEQIRIHDLRHSHTSMLIDMNIPIIQISERLGHENVETTWKIYAHLYPGKAETVADKLGDLFVDEDVDSEDDF
ncbi:MAG: site-specific integrase [Lachnospiraceae bacterium]|nr:site-specific integrase [Lachnospiraceae bacterium]